MLALASQSISFAGPAAAPSMKVSPQMLFGAKAPAAKKAPAFAYGLPGNFNALGGSELNFDPAGFLEGKSELEVNRYREAELTHGRVGMLASLGFLVQEKFHPLFSGDGGPAIDQIPALPVWLWAVMVYSTDSEESCSGCGDATMAPVSSWRVTPAGSVGKMLKATSSGYQGTNSGMSHGVSQAGMTGGKLTFRASTSCVNVVPDATEYWNAGGFSTARDAETPSGSLGKTMPDWSCWHQT